MIHGDLWSGNVAGNKDTGSPVIFDPSSCWGHNEYELGVCHMFGGECCGVAMVFCDLLRAVE